MQQRIWLSYDLGLRGDYESLYTWLDNHGAKECGDNIAVLTYEFKANLVNELKKDLSRAIELHRTKDRIYLVYPGEDGKYKGRFLFGKRKRTPWQGYAVGVAEGIDD